MVSSRIAPAGPNGFEPDCAGRAEWFRAGFAGRTDGFAPAFAGYEVDVA
jgi:hypothetical protein